MSVTIQLTKNVEHGLGHLLNPLDPEDFDTDWMTELWLYEPVSEPH
jgi:hypothetical protein